MATAAVHAPVLRVTGLRKHFREGGRSRAVLAGVDVQVAGGERVALLGPSGCGKSTLLNLIGGIEQPDAGEVVVDGRQLTRLSDTERTLFRRRDLGFVYQFFNLIPTLTVAENLRLPLELNGVRTPVARTRAGQWLERIGLTDREAVFPDRLSGGEQQRVAVARALIHEPRLVLADEPTGNLDAATGARISALLHTASAQTGAALLLVTHSRELAAAADRVLQLSAGRIQPAGADS